MKEQIIALLDKRKIEYTVYDDNPDEIEISTPTIGPQGDAFIFVYDTGVCIDYPTPDGYVMGEQTTDIREFEKNLDYLINHNPQGN